MTTTATPLRPPAEPAVAAPAPRTRSRRWIRLVLPAGVVVLLVLASLLAYQVQQPDEKNRGYLSPTSGRYFGGAKLADLLGRRGITVERQTRTSDALVSAQSGNATLFIPTPNLVHPFYLRMLKLLPATTRVVLVDPSDTTLGQGRFPISVIHRYLVAHTDAPGCELAAARDAGPAGVGRSVYSNVDPETGEHELNRCYGGSVVEFSRQLTSITAVGSADPFRNDRIGEHGNQQLAVGLLSRSPRLVWLDLHRREQQPGYVDNPGLAGQPAAPPSLGPGSPDPDFPLPPTGPASRGNGDQGGTAGASAPNPLWEAFPAWLFAAIALIALGFVMLALARARRLGAPVAEPLPVTVRAKETVEGRGRLYQRAKARVPALRTLQVAARDRLAHLLDLPPTVDRATLVAAVSEATGWPAEAVDDTLFRDELENDEAMVTTAVRLEGLLAAVTTAERGAKP
jgi:hypothetical protein